MVLIPIFCVLLYISVVLSYFYFIYIFIHHNMIERTEQKVQQKFCSFFVVFAISSCMVNKITILIFFLVVNRNIFNGVRAKNNFGISAL